MINLQSRNFQLAWAIWILILGLSLFFVHTLQYVTSFSEYLNAFIILDLPSSWCPTFLTLFGISTLAALLISSRIFTTISRFAGLVLLPVGILATITFTVESSVIDFMYIYAQTIHVSEILTGLFTIYLIKKK